MSRYNSYRHELEGRESGLGEVDELKLKEQGIEFDREPIGGGTPSDMREQARVQQAAEKAPLGYPNQAVEIISTFDVRPIDAVDFASTGTSSDSIVESGSTGAPNAVTVLSHTYNVPDGRIGILRSFSLRMTPNLGFALNGDASAYYGANPNHLLTSIRVNGVIAEGYNEIALGNNVTDYPCYIIAGEGDAIVIEFAIGSGIQGPPGFSSLDVSCWFRLHGNLLKPRGLPLQMEPGTLRKGKPKLFTGQ